MSNPTTIMNTDMDMDMDRSGYSYYDDLRETNPSDFTPIFTDENRVGRNLHRYSYHNKSNHDNEEDVVLCHTPVFIRYTTKDKKDYSDAGYGGAAAAMLAMHHWNNGNGIVVDSIQDIHQKCPIRFTTELFDTQSNAVPAVRGLTDMMIRKPSSIAKPQPCAIVGTLYSSVSTKFAITSGVYDLLQVSPGASSDALDDPTQYPLFSRTHPADGGAALLLPKYLKEQLNVTNFAIVFVHTDGGFGTAYQKVVLKYAEDHQMNVKSVPITYYNDPERIPSKEDIKRELQPLLDSKLNYIIGVFFFNNYKPIMEAAHDLGLAGEGKFWFFAGSMSDRIYEKSITYDRNSDIFKAMKGNAIITDGGAAPGTEPYKSFLREWRRLGDDDEFLRYVNAKQPPPLPGTETEEGDPVLNFHRTKEYFYREPIAHIAVYSYEAIIGIGLAACEAARVHNNSYVDNDVFSGKQHHDAFTKTSFLSASGNVTFGPTTSSRNETSTYFVVANILETEGNDDEGEDGAKNHTDGGGSILAAGAGRNKRDRKSNHNEIALQGRNHKYFDALTGNWTEFATTQPFIYSDGTTNKPSEIFPATENQNLITGGVRAYCLVESAIAMAASVAFLIYTIKTMRKRGGEIARSQPPFLIMICVGTFLTATSLIPLSVDEMVTRNTMALNVSCSMFYWMFSLGFTITFAALFSKLRRATKISEAGLRLRRINISIKDVLKPFLALFFSNAIILLVLQTAGNLRWERSTLELNEFDQVISSEGSCVSEDLTWYLSSLLFVNGIALLLACYEAYRGRNTASELNESKYVGMAMICIFQSCFFGVPLIIISASNKSAFLFVVTSICFVICIATLLFIFLPKIIVQRQRDSLGPNSRVTGISEEAQRLRQTMRMTGVSLISQQSTSSLGGGGNGHSGTISRQGSKRSCRGDAFPLRDSMLQFDNRSSNRSRSRHALLSSQSSYRSSRGSGSRDTIPNAFSLRASLRRSAGSAMSAVSFGGESMSSLAVLADNENENDESGSGTGSGSGSLSESTPPSSRRGSGIGVVTNRGSTLRKRSSRFSQTSFTAISECEDTTTDGSGGGGGDRDRDRDRDHRGSLLRSSVSSLHTSGETKFSVISTADESKECSASVSRDDDDEEELEPFLPSSAHDDPVVVTCATHHQEGVPNDDDDGEEDDANSSGYDWHGARQELSDSFKLHAERVENLRRERGPTPGNNDDDVMSNDSGVGGNRNVMKEEEFLPLVNVGTPPPTKTKDDEEKVSKYNDDDDDDDDEKIHQIV